MGTIEPSPLQAVMAMVGGSLVGGPPDLPAIADQLDTLRDSMGVEAFRTLAMGVRELHTEITNEQRFTYGD